MISRRKFQQTAGGIFCAATLGVRAQPANRVYRVALLRPTAAPPTLDPVSAEVILAKAFARMGYQEGRNFHLEHRYGDGDPQRTAGNCARTRSTTGGRDHGGIADRAAGRDRGDQQLYPSSSSATSIRSPPASCKACARPGRNVTGVLASPEGTLGAKKLELLKAAIPTARRIVVLESEDPAASRIQMPELQRAASTLGVELPLISIRNGDLDDAFKRIVATKPDALFVIANTYLIIHRAPVIAQAIKHRLASMWEWREQVQDGGLMSYGTSVVSRWEQAATCVDRILKGAKPGDTAVDMPTNLGLVLNLVTAKMIGLQIAQSLVLRADEVIR